MQAVKNKAERRASDWLRSLPTWKITDYSANAKAAKLNKRGMLTAASKWTARTVIDDGAHQTHRRNRAHGCGLAFSATVFLADDGLDYRLILCYRTAGFCNSPHYVMFHQSGSLSRRLSAI